ncbi:GNAT family N-acetyltransferase [Marinobacter bohaiensis]|uniref:GNAT family N-acetyltransferase n=1 Tax=Marinobacter bohaiensis TaxID=2201898 RepID=UPI000DAF2FF1|nr:GNAT family N-acetyltransferase [Marinobacter bohaiensis]
MSLFQTRAWQDAWWAIWGETPGFSKVARPAEDGSGLYIDRYRFKGVLPVRCLQFVGTNYRRLSTPRTEYNGFGLDDTAAGDAPLQVLDRTAWSEAVFRDVPEASVDFQCLQRLADERGWLCREVARDTAYQIDTRGPFDAYQTNLGRNTRLRFFNRRKVLEGLAEVRQTNAFPDDINRFFELLNGFHRDRWGQPCFSDASLAFHRRFLENVPLEGGQPRLSILWSGPQPVSVLYNVVYRGCLYNIQSGFLEHFHRKLALGSLHLGYAIEDAFHDEAVHQFDLLAGSGKNCNYKRPIATDSCELVSVMLVRSAWAKGLYRLKERL